MLFFSRKIQDLKNEMESIYSSAKPEGKSLEELSDVIGNSRNWNDLLHAWEIWRESSGKNIREIFDEFVKLLNSVAKENGKNLMYRTRSCKPPLRVSHPRVFGQNFV